MHPLKIARQITGEQSEYLSWIHWYWSLICMILWQMENIQNCLLCYTVFVFHQKRTSERFWWWFVNKHSKCFSNGNETLGYILQEWNWKSIKRKQRIARQFHRDVKLCRLWLFSKHSYTSWYRMRFTHWIHWGRESSVRLKATENTLSC